MASIAAVLIVKNESAILASCLDKLQWCDEIIVVDAGSDDNTVDIAKQYTDKVFIEADWQGYGIQRQRAQAKATSDWVVMIDADEQVTDSLQQSIQQVIAEDDRGCVYQVARLSYVFGRYIRHSGWYPDYVIRLYPNTQAGYGNDVVHEKVVFPDSMQVKSLRGDLLHFTYRDLQHYLVKSAAYAAAWAEQRYQRGKRANLLQAMLHGIGCFFKMYLLRAGFLDGPQGFLLALLSGHSTFVKYADLWIKQRTKSS